MLKAIRNRVYDVLKLLNRGKKRSVKAKKNIAASLLIKGVSIFIGFYMVPLTIGYVNKEQYGVWLTLYSVVGWFTFFDIGLGHGLRNKLSEALASNKIERAKTLVSSTYAILLGIIISLLCFFFIIQPFLNWQEILNATAIDAQQLRLVAIATFTFFCINFVLKLVNAIFLANQEPAAQNFFNLLSNICALITIYILTKTTNGSLLYLSIALGLAPIVVLSVVSLVVFNGKYKKIAPSFRYIRVQQFKELGGIGFRFFLIQISSIIIFSTDNMIIAQVLGPAEVPSYAIAFKYFGLVTALFAIVTAPFWSAYTEAYVKNDIGWISSTNKKLIKVWFGLVLLSVLLLAISAPFYRFWVPEVEVPFHLSLMMCLYVNLIGWGNIFVVFINGVGKIQIQLYAGIIATIVNIPLSYFFSKTLGWGVSGVIAATMICIAYGPILAPIQYKKIINRTATGVWNK